MEQIIYFEEEGNKSSVIWFVQSFRSKKWYRKEKITYSLTSLDAYEFTDNDDMAKVCDRIKKDFPNAKVCCCKWTEFVESHNSQTFWVIGKCEYNWISGYYSNSYNKNVDWTRDMNDVEIYMDYDCCKETADRIRLHGERIVVQGIYLNLVNELLTPIMMLTCTSKSGRQETKYFARIEGNRIRLVKTSDAAKKFTYGQAIQKFEYLRSHNKNFLYAVLPAFKDNVSARNLEQYMKDKKVSRMVTLTLKLKWLNR